MNRPTYNQALLQTVGYRSIRSVVNSVLEKYGLNTAQWVILGLVSEKPNKLRVTDAARELRVEDPLVTNLVQALVASDLVKSTSHKRDKRAKVLALTTSGEHLVTDIEPELTKALAPIEACASPADWETYFATLEKIITATGPDN